MSNLPPEQMTAHAGRAIGGRMTDAAETAAQIIAEGYTTGPHDELDRDTARKVIAALVGGGHLHAPEDCHANWKASYLQAKAERDDARAALTEAVGLLDALINHDEDLGDCPYLARWKSLPDHDPEAVCAYGCSDEPQCMTCEPNEGWPSVRARAFLAGQEQPTP